MDYDSLLTEAKDEKSKLMEELMTRLERLRPDKMMEREANLAENLNKSFGTLLPDIVYCDKNCCLTILFSMNYCSANTYTNYPIFLVLVYYAFLCKYICFFLMLCLSMSFLLEYTWMIGAGVSWSIKGKERLK